MIGVALVIEPSLDLSIFAPVSEQLTGVNHVSDADARDLEGLQHTLRVLQSFGRTEPYLLQVGFLIAGPEHDVALLLEGMRMPHLCAGDCPHGARACVVVGSLDQWRMAINWGNRAPTACRQACNAIYRQFCQRGLRHIFEGEPVEQRDGTFLLK